MPITNSQFGVGLGNFTASPYGCSVKFKVATGIVGIAGTSTGKWCTAGNLIGVYSGGQYIECSITYSATGGPQPQGWYLSIKNNGVDIAYHSLGYDPTGDFMLLYLQIGSYSNWTASYQDVTKGGSKTTYDTGVIASTLVAANLWFENGGDTSCCDYRNFGGTQFTNVTFYNISNSVITNNWSASVHPNPNPPHKCTTPSTSDCIFVDTIAFNIYYNCTVC
ncbi:MAG: hypothetical protein ACREAR_01575 [Nitrosotalea sp.]